jgi:hypothetical protein
MVAAGEADAVVVLFRDRIARGVYAQLLAEEFRRHGARLVALNSRSDDSPDGELGDNILDVIAAWERKKIAERMNRGKRRKAKEGKVGRRTSTRTTASASTKARTGTHQTRTRWPSGPANLPHGGGGGHDAQRDPLRAREGRHTDPFGPESLEPAVSEGTASTTMHISRTPRGDL